MTILVSHRETREIFMRNRCSVPNRINQRIGSHLSISFLNNLYISFIYFYAHKPTASGTKINLHILDSNLIVKLRLTQSS